MKQISILLFVVLMILDSSCRKEPQSLSITLYNKPLAIIQSYIKGNWKLQYIIGGYGRAKYPATINSYMKLDPNHIIIGNDLDGVSVDTTIVWVRAANGPNDSTYLLSFRWFGYPYPEYKIVDQIKNDTLIIRDVVLDGYNGYYTKY